MDPQRGDIWWCESANSGRRPCVVLTRDTAIPRMRRVLVALATTTIRGIDTEVVLEPGTDPIPRLSALNLDTPEVVPVARLTDRLGRLSDDRMRDVCAALAVAVDCR
ncbi:MAG: type II toxin-antitoxin system PemK/MazF family toxin [Actinobacteria bacterium]|nr:type II toxin-antitoxin system PemK/MazF family toxin [Actinomycetota bacterium]